MGVGRQARGAVTRGSGPCRGLCADPAQEQELRTRWTDGGRTLDIPRACLRYRRADAPDMDLVAEAVGRFDADERTSPG